MERNYPVFTVSKKAELSLKNGHPWVYGEEVESVSGGTLLLTLNGVSDKIPVSRRRVSLLKKALGI